MKIKPIHTITAAGIAALFAVISGGCGGTDYIGALRQGNERDPLIVEEAVEWLGNKGKNLNAERKPFFLLVTIINPHDIMGLSSKLCMRF